MRKLLLLLFALGFPLIKIYSQTTLYSENFNGATHTFTLNSSDVSSVTNGYNLWVVNNSYNGGSFNEPCFGFSTSVGNTPSQPGAITGSPNSNYLHIVNQAAQAAGISNANFLASDGGFLCNGNQNYFAKMSNDISTLGYTNVTFSCYYLCAGSSATYGELYYSTNGGATWQLQLGNIYNVSSWQTLTQTNAIWNNQATLRFGFRFVNNSSFSASDPPLSVDEIVISGTAAVTNTITTTSVSEDTLCPNDAVVVNYSASGTFNSGNVFTAQLSDALGSFASPTPIGSITSTTSGSINATIPGSTAAGTGYRIRVVSSNPSMNGTDNGSNLIIGAYPSANFNSNVSGFNVQFIDNSTGGTSWSWDFGDGNTSTLQNPTHVYTSVDTFTVCLTVTGIGGCEASTCRTVIINPFVGINDELETTLMIYPNPADNYVIVPSISNHSFEKLNFYSMDGKLIKSTNLSSNNTNSIIMIDDLAPGIYLMQLISSEKIHQQSLIKR
ncbi:MAG: PKD domain-containing protein [Flavobacteriales bacterium]|nr:PKD domain-containing protein [Flavobacteriales bacterium]